MIKQYAKTDADGYVIGLRQSESVPGAKWFEVTKTERTMLSVNERLRHIGGGVLKVAGGTWLPDESVDMRRMRAYPAVGDQLGAIWKAIAPLIEHPEAEAILARIQAVKDANPKPSN